MAYQPETGEWAAGVYQIEEEDLVLGNNGGAIGIDNKPLLDLANRTGHLKETLGTVAEV
ncbi:MAG: hypothetical protein LBU82_04955 [Treponema sp.]|jgi:hypothetical protein|nr:hypothetical protein [Treponema sp.]